MLICATGGRFPPAWLQPIEQRRVRFALISALFAEIKAACSLRVVLHTAHNATLLLAKAVLRYGFGRSRRLSLQSTNPSYTNIVVKQIL